MDVLIVIIVLALVSAAVAVAFGFFRGWFRMAPVSTSQNYQFVLMRKAGKAGKIDEDARNAPAIATPAGPVATKPPEQSEELH